MRSKIFVPSSLGVVNNLIGQMGSYQLELAHEEVELNKKIKKAMDEAAPAISRYKKAINDILTGLMIYAEKYRREIIADEKCKTIKLFNGKMGWHLNPPSVDIRSNQKVLKRLKELGFTDFIRIKESINKKAILERRIEAEAVEGIKIVQKEEFFVKPKKTSIQISRILKLKKAKKRKKIE
ncbi:MAG: host-nuclease inhibitor Gam family protein [Patescibacteria group bacterium]